MTFRPQTGSRRNVSGKQFSKSARDKKSKEKKRKSSAKYLQEEIPKVSGQEVAQRVLNSLGKLGNQVFALSPFSQYFDDWLLTLQQVISEFEFNPALTVDKQFVKERTHILLNVEGSLAKKKLQELNLTAEAKALADNNHLIVETDKEYAEQTREYSIKRNAEVQRVSTRIRELEEQLASQQEIKISFYKINTRRRVAEQLDQTIQNLEVTKNGLEVKLEKFATEQEKLHDNYEKKKQELSENSDRLHKELEKLDTDTSITIRQETCNALANAIKTLFKRVPELSIEK